MKAKGSRTRCGPSSSQTAGVEEAKGNALPHYLGTFGLTLKQLRFVDLYLFNGNASQAYIDVGYAAKNWGVAAAGASRMLGNVRVAGFNIEGRRQGRHLLLYVAAANASRLIGVDKVAAYLQHRTSAVLERRGINAANILGEIAYSAFLDVRRAFDAAGKLLSIHEMPEDVARDRRLRGTPTSRAATGPRRTSPPATPRRPRALPQLTPRPHKKS